MTGALLGWTKDYKGEGRGLANSALGLQRLEELLLGGVRLVDVKACWAALWRLGLGRGVGGWREGGDADDDFAGLGALQLFAGDAFDGVGIGLQGFDLIAELDVFGVEAVDVFADFPDFELSAAHGDEAVSAENVVDDKSQDKQAEDCAAMLLQEVADLIFYRLVHVARTHFVASSVKRADAFALSASM